jgi:hypothetical protein
LSILAFQWLNQILKEEQEGFIWTWSHINSNEDLKQFWTNYQLVKHSKNGCLNMTTDQQWQLKKLQLTKLTNQLTIQLIFILALCDCNKN